MNKKLFIIPALVILIALGIFFFVQKPNHLCTGDENIIFSCKIKNQKERMSVCSSKDLDNTKGYLKFRYGTPNKILHEHPKENKPLAEAFDYNFYSRPYQAEDLVTTEISLYFDGDFIFMNLIESHAPNGSTVFLNGYDNENGIEKVCENKVQGSLVKLRELDLEF